MMQIRLKFLGAAGNVTGSCYLLEANNTRLLVDCGSYQEHDLKSRNWQPFPVNPESIDAILLTHAHIDHSGLIPKIVKDGFRGNIYCTDVTAHISEIMLTDAGHIMEEDALNKKRRHDKECRKARYPEIPLYTVEDARRAMRYFKAVKYGNTFEPGKGLEVTFFDAGHVLGSAMIQVKIKQKQEESIIIFSGDIGRWNKPILHDPTIFSQADYILVESTYGDRRHSGAGEVKEQLAEIIKSTVKSGGNIVIPTFALERAQEVLYYIRELRNEGGIPDIMVFLDSPMAANITEVFERHSEYYDKETREIVNQGISPFKFPRLKIVQSVEESRAINNMSGAVIMAGSGMCTAGRIKYHLIENITRPESTILFVGFQEKGTLGREILDGAERVRILGQYHPVKARIEKITGFSAHADRDELLKWLNGIKNTPRRVFVVHGDQEVSEEFGRTIRETKNWNVTVPAYLDEVELG